jgi:DEAD/DEAH box helicase domain-containing protein
MGGGTDAVHINLAEAADRGRPANETAYSTGALSRRTVTDADPLDDVVAALRERRYYDGQIAADRTLPGQSAAYADVEMDDRLADALAERGVERLYRHQATAIEAVRGGENVVLATPTASGKSLAYTVPAFERATEGGRTLYLGPQNALVADQADALSSLARGLPFGTGVAVETYTGRLDDDERRAVRERRPTILLSNPDMLHYALLPHAHRIWEWFFESLSLVVIDEVHEYRGVFGTHVALLLRRLRRICERFGADPEVVCCSATIGNPVEHAARVTGAGEESFRLVDADASAAGPRRWLLWNPPRSEGGEGRRRSNHVEAKNLFVDLVAGGHQTLVFTRARQTAERYAMDAAEALRERGETDLADRVHAYQAALTDDRRRELEAGLQSGEARGVWSTNALELGVDIGGLDAVILDGYPGTRMNTFQQAGRAGRGTDPALVALVAGEDQLDQYVMATPEELFEGDPERAVLDPDNEHVLPGHLRSAARENWLSPADERRFGPSFEAVRDALTAQGDLEKRGTLEGPRWTYEGGGSPQHEMNLRRIDDGEVILRTESGGERVATLSLADALRDAHPGAIYHHQGRTYEVVDLDLERGVAALAPTWADYYTRVLTDKEIRVEDDREERRPLPREDVPVRFADVTLTTRVTGFERRDAERGETLGTQDLSLPPQTLETRALYYTVPDDLRAALQAREGNFAGAIHAAEHAMISMFPLELLCDRSDVGGLSTPLHPHTGRSTVFVYDGYPGGVGLTRAAFEDVTALAERTRAMVRACDCEAGCPACVQSPQCGNANEPLDKGLAIRLLDGLLGD